MGILAGVTAMACDVEQPRPSAAAEQVEAKPDAMAGAVMASTYTQAESAASPLAPDVAAAFARNNCRNGYRQRGQRLCISDLKPRATYMDAVYECRQQYGYVCSYEDLTYLYKATQADANYDPQDVMMGPLADDDMVYCGNRSITRNNDQDEDNFEATCNKSDRRRYWCCHDRQ